MSMFPEFLEHGKPSAGPSYAVWPSISANPRPREVADIIKLYEQRLAELRQSYAEVIARSVAITDDESGHALKFRARRPYDGFIVFSYRNHISILHSLEPSPSAHNTFGLVSSGYAMCSGSEEPALVQLMERCGRTVIRLNTDRVGANINIPGAVPLHQLTTELELGILWKVAAIENKMIPLLDPRRAGHHHENN